MECWSTGVLKGNGGIMGRRREYLNDGVVEREEYRRQNTGDRRKTIAAIEILANP